MRPWGSEILIMGVQPRGAQVRRRNGASMNPDSSTKTMKHVFCLPGAELRSTSVPPNAEGIIPCKALQNARLSRCPTHMIAGRCVVGNERHPLRLVKNRLSDNVGGVKHFSRTLSDNVGGVKHFSRT